MQTYKAFLKIALKRCPSAMIYFVIFMVVCIISASQGKENTEEIYKDEKINFTVFNRDGSELGEAVKNYLSENNEYVEVEDEESAIRLSLYYRSVYYILIIPEGFEEAILAGEDMEYQVYKVNDSAQGYYMDMKTESYIQTVKAYIAAGCGITEATQKASDVILDEVNVNLLSDIEEKEVNGNPMSTSSTSERPAIYYFYQYVPYVFLAIVITALGPILITFGKRDVKMRINISAQTFKSYSAQMFLGVVTFGLVILALFNVMAVVLYGSMLTVASMVCYLILTFCFLMVCLGITYFGGFIFKNSDTMGSFANVVSLGFSFLGGVFVPLDLLGDTMINIARFTPTYWYIQANNVIMNVKNFSDINIGEFAKDCGVQLLFALAFFCVGLVVLKHKREEA